MMQQAPVLIHLPSVDSTNNWAKQHLDEFERDRLTVILADTQTGGRGRFNRKWLSPPKQNVYATFCFFMPANQPNIFNITQVLSVSACKALESLHFAARIKWPNDILLSKKKMGGILCETVLFQSLMGVIAGIGLNINMSQEALKELDRAATSLLIEGGKEIAPESVINLLTDSFSKDLDVFLEKGFSPFLFEYAERLIHQVHEPLRFHEKETLCEGFFHSINEDGSLNLQLPSGKLKRYYSGEIRECHRST